MWRKHDENRTTLYARVIANPVAMLKLPADLPEALHARHAVREAVAAVDGQHDAVDEARPVRGEEGGGARHVLRRTRAAQRVHPGQGRHYLRIENKEEFT